MHGERDSACLNGGLGAVPPVGSRGNAPDRGVSPEADGNLRFAMQIPDGLFIYLLHQIHNNQISNH